MPLPLLLLALCPAAPAPALRPARAADLPGVYELDYGGSLYWAHFTPGGRYSAWREDAAWQGAWRFEGGRLCVREWAAGPDDYAHAWSVPLTRLPSGALAGQDGSLEVTLRRAR
jgi:hypothetical protein